MTMIMDRRNRKTPRANLIFTIAWRQKSRTKTPVIWLFLATSLTDFCEASEHHLNLRFLSSVNCRHSAHLYHKWSENKKIEHQTFSKYIPHNKNREPACPGLHLPSWISFHITLFLGLHIHATFFQFLLTSVLTQSPLAKLFFGQDFLSTGIHFTSVPYPKSLQISLMHFYSSFKSWLRYYLLKGIFLDLLCKIRSRSLKQS